VSWKEVFAPTTALESTTPPQLQTLIKNIYISEPYYLLIPWHGIPKKNKQASFQVTGSQSSENLQVGFK
jgi:hypothetical protein